MTTLQFYSGLLQPLWLCISSVAILSLGCWWLTARFSSDPLVRMLVTLLAGFYLIFLLEFGSYHTGLPQFGAFAFYLVSILISLFRIRKESSGGQTSIFPVNAWLCWTALAIWLTGVQALIVNYGGSFWYGDWYEHYERSLFYVEQWPSTARFLNNMWTLPARGPLFNAAAAMLMTGGSGFQHFQIYSSLLNSFAFLPLALLLRDVAGLKEKTALTWSVLICAIAPFALMQETYTWTKFLTNGIILAAIYFYRKGLTENRPAVVILAFLVFAEAMLAHYLALSFALLFALHFVYVVFRRGWKKTLILQVAGVCLLLMCPWFLYIFTVFGIRSSISATSTFGNYIQMQADKSGEVPGWDLVFAGNLLTTSIPYSWRHQNSGLMIAPRMIQLDSRAGPVYTPKPEEANRITEWFSGLVNNLDSFPGCLGWAGCFGLAIAVPMWIRRRLKSSPPTVETSGPGPIFWTLFFVLGIPLNILLSRDFSFHGVAHLNLQPFISLSAVLIVKMLKDCRLAVRWVFLAVFLFESALISGALITLEQRMLPIRVDASGRMIVTGRVEAGYKYVNNYVYKLQQKAVFLSDNLRDLRFPFFCTASALAASLLLLMQFRQGAAAPDRRS